MSEKEQSNHGCHQCKLSKDKKTILSQKETIEKLESAHKDCHSQLQFCLNLLETKTKQLEEAQTKIKDDKIYIEKLMLSGELSTRAANEHSIRYTQEAYQTNYLRAKVSELELELAKKK